MTALYRAFALVVFFFCCWIDAYSQATPFPAGPAVSVLDYGAAPDDGLEDTAALVAAMGAGGRTVRVPPGQYHIGRIEIPGSTVLELSPGVVLRDTGQLGPTDRLVNIRSANVRIVGAGARVEADRSSYTTGEFRHGIFLFGARNVHIIGLQSSSHGGDGFYLGTGTREVTIENCGAANNRRQGISIVSGVAVLVRDSTFATTNGTNPQCGVDVEPNNNGDLLQGIKLQGVRTVSNVGCGITVGLSAYTAAAPAATITITGHLSTGESRPFVRSSIRAVDRVSYLSGVSR